MYNVCMLAHPDQVRFMVERTTLPTEDGVMVFMDKLSNPLPNGIESSPAWIAHGECHEPDGKLIFSSGAALVSLAEGSSFTSGVAFDEGMRDRLAGLDRKTPIQNPGILTISYPLYIARLAGAIPESAMIVDIDLPPEEATTGLQLHAAAIGGLVAYMENLDGPTIKPRS